MNQQSRSGRVIPWCLRDSRIAMGSGLASYLGTRFKTASLDKVSGGVWWVHSIIGAFMSSQFIMEFFRVIVLAFFSTRSVNPISYGITLVRAGCWLRAIQGGFMWMWTFKLV